MIDLHDFDAASFAKEIGLSAKVLAVEIPDELCDALQIAPKARVRRADWRQWLHRLADISTLLLWSTQRRDDDQEFLSKVARVLPKGVKLWSFHDMLLQTVDRLTGDAVQMLLLTDGLADGRCANTGVGYYVRAFARAKGTKAEALGQPKAKRVAKRKPAAIPRAQPARVKAHTKPLGKTTKAKVKRAAKKTVKKVAKKAAPKKTAKKAAPKKTAKKAAPKKPAKKVVKKTAKKAAPKKPAKKAAPKKTAKKVVKKTAKKPIKKTAKTPTKKQTKSAKAAR